MDDITYKLAELDVPSDDPFHFDALNREPSVEAVSSLIGELSGPFVLAIDSPWGTGKTTFVRMLQAVLEKKEHPCLYFNAWETDFSTDPLVAFLGEISTLLSEDISKDSALAKNFDKAKKIAGRLARRVIPAAAKVATYGALDLDKVVEKTVADGVSDSVSDAVDEYLKEKELIDEFHKTLSKVVDQLNQEGKPSQIIIFVDEIDRCRPTYAVELLERIKHLFNIENVIFVVSLDKQQLRTSLGAVYGQGINADEYLRRFIDLEFLLPKPDMKAFAKSLFDKFGLSKVLSARSQNDSQLNQRDFQRLFAELAKHFGLSLRAMEHCFTRILVAILTSEKGDIPSPYLLTILTILRTNALDVYRRFALEGGNVKGVMEYVKSNNEGAQLVDSEIGLAIERQLIMAKCSMVYGLPEEAQAYKKIIDDTSSTKTEKERAGYIINSLENLSYLTPPLDYAVSQLELAAQFK
ncbi:MAG: P-loop NTPase fold protein [Candidatus Electrothrix sp. GW3-4]|uniref:KAP family P-loop NTPase fold protein n=1 Tax=Candidatus Electrothrix sp. GW3-4 TaxID=3126740 RepID=UPI0030CE3B1E